MKLIKLIKVIYFSTRLSFLMGRIDHLKNEGLPYSDELFKIRDFLKKMIETKYNEPSVKAAFELLVVIDGMYGIKQGRPVNKSLEIN